MQFKLSCSLTEYRLKLHFIFSHCGVRLQFLTKWVIIITTKYSEADPILRRSTWPPCCLSFAEHRLADFIKEQCWKLCYKSFGPEENWLLASQSPSTLSKITPARAAARSLYSHPLNWRIAAQGGCVIQSTDHFRDTALTGKGVKWLPESQLGVRPPDFTDNYPQFIAVRRWCCGFFQLQ